MWTKVGGGRYDSYGVTICNVSINGSRAPEDSQLALGRRKKSETAVQTSGFPY